MNSLSVLAEPVIEKVIEEMTTPGVADTDITFIECAVGLRPEQVLCFLFQKKIHLEKNLFERISELLNFISQLYDLSKIYNYPPFN